MRLWAVVVSCVLVLGDSLQGMAQPQQSGPRTLEGLLNSDEAQTPTATAEAAKADATETGPKRPAGTVARPKDGVQHPDLDKAWVNYDAAVTKAAEGIRSAINKQFDAATAKGDLDEADKWLKSLEKFEKAGDVPTDKETKAAVIAAVADFNKARDELTKAYEALVKTLTIEKKLTEARAARNESLGLENNTATSRDGTSVPDRRKEVAVPANAGKEVNAPVAPKTGVVTFNGHRYRFFPEGVSWGEAKQRCKEMGGHLAIIETGEENEFLTRMLKDWGSQERCWIGASRQGGAWVWENGERVKYTNWGPREPSNTRGSHWIMIRGNGDWHDFATRHGPCPFVCEWDD